MRKRHCHSYCDGYCFWYGDRGYVCDTGDNSHEGYCPMAESDCELEELAAAMIEAEERKKS